MIRSFRRKFKAATVIASPAACEGSSQDAGHLYPRFQDETVPLP